MASPSDGSNKHTQEAGYETVVVIQSTDINVVV